MRTGLALILVAVSGCSHRNSANSAPTLRPSAVRASQTIETSGVGLDQLAAPAGEIVDPTVLVINGDTLTVEDILKPVRGELERKAASLTPARYHTEMQESLANRIRSEARDLLLYQQASRRVSEPEQQAFDKYVDQEIRDIVNKKYGGRQTRYEKELAANGSSLSQERDRIRRDLIIIRYLRQTVSSNVAEPTRAELWHFFQEHKAELAKAERREMHLIEQSKDAEGRTTLEQARAELAAGQPFDAVARKLSQGALAVTGGNWGLIGKGSVREKFEPAVDVLFRLDAGQTSDIIETADALFIVRCGQIERGEEPDFEKMQPALARRYNDFQFNLHVDELVAKLQSTAVIRPEDINLFLQRVVDAAPKAAFAGAP